MGAHPFSEFVDPSGDARTKFLSEFVATISREATDTLRPKYDHLYGFEFATRPGAPGDQLVGTASPAATEPR